MSLFKDCGIPPGHDELGLLLQPGQTDQRNMTFRRQVLPWGIESRLIEAHGPIDGKTYGTPMPGQKGPFSPQKMHLPAGQHLMLEPMPAAARLHEGNYMMLMLATGVLGTAFAWARLALKI